MNDGYILGLDISSVSTGWAILCQDEVIAYGKITFKSKQKHGERLNSFEAQIKAILDKFQPNVVGIEDIFAGRNMKTYKILALYHGVAYKVVWAYHGTMPIVATPSEQRKRIQKAVGVKLTGKRKKNKELVFNYIKKRYNFVDFDFAKDNDMVDAIAVGLATNLAQKSTATKPVKKRRTRKKSDESK